ncbi:Cytoplasmic dynein 2 heavy chain 1 [Trichoplax sp. H2]|nr:Cytoplasmic dynein 2 heavy chain 1 [Trichoplax sp. H2]|eukprot:RDD40688.1 Cytoplasmic dynein 2 heavy chain 1 [Trichoplax sp. H2]
MPTVDTRKEFLLTTASSYLGIPISDNTITRLGKEVQVDTFLDDGNCTTLNLTLQKQSDGSKAIVAKNTASPSDTSQQTLLFYKLKPAVITPDNIHNNVVVSSLLDSPVDTLYHSVHHIFAPLLLRDQKWSQSLDPKLQKLISELEAGLASTVRQQNNQSKFQSADQSNNFAGILTPSDEFNYWSELSLSSTKQEIRERAGHFKELFQQLASGYANIDATTLGDSIELIEQTQDVLDDVWKQLEFKPPYSEDRMRHLLGVISGFIERYIQRKLNVLNLWTGPYHQVRDSIKAGLSICERWTVATETLTAQFWKRYGPNPWSGEKFNPEDLSRFSGRLEEILNLRSTHEQLTHLLSVYECDELKTDQVFQSFSSSNPLYYNPYTEPLWRAAVSQYEKGMIPAEQRIASKLRSQLRELQGKPHQLLREFQRYRELIKRSNIRKSLVTERETLLGQLVAYMKSLKEEFTSHLNIHQSGGKQDASSSGKNIPEVVNNIIWTRQLEAKVDETITTAEVLLGDLDGFKQFRKDITDLLEELQGYRNDLFDNWSHSMISALSDPKQSLSLQTSGRLMELSKKDQGKLIVHYSERLVTLLREVRQLSALGYVIPAKIQHASETARKFYRHGVILKQVAHFYNTIDQQMIPSQQAMMLNTALSFEKLIKNPKTGSTNTNDGRIQITWDNPKELEDYITKLQSTADKLMSENRLLRKCHNTITEKVTRLFSIELLKQQQRWKDGLMEIRQIMANLGNISQKFNAESMKTWKLHWDHQLYKALEHQYQLSLESLNENLSEIKVELVFRQQRLQFRPPIEEIRAKYYREIKKFICIPNHFRGVSDNVSPLDTIFPAMIDRNSDGFAVVYRKAEQLFERLENARNMFIDWTAIGAIDIDKVVEEHLTTVNQWEKNFRALKARGREAEKLPSTIKVDCIIVSTIPVKTTIDDHIQQLYDALVNSLRRSITSHITVIDEFLNDAIDKLSTRPQSVEEISQAKGDQKKLSEERSKVYPHFEKAESKNKLLRSVAGQGIDQLSQLQPRWDKFELMMESHELMMEEQTKVMRGNVESRIKTFNLEIEKFASRWHQLKPSEIDSYSDTPSCLKAVESLKERRAEFNELVENSSKIKEDCVHFELAEPEFQQITELQTDLQHFESMWKLFEDFMIGLDKLGQEDWLSFRASSFQFDEFLTEWDDKLRMLSLQNEANTMTIKLQKDIDRYKALVPVLKFVRGEPLSADHWIELFRIVSLPRGTTLEKLRFHDILSVSENIVAKAGELKELNSRAHGEVSIREALHELELWGASATFNLTPYNDTHGHELMLIKEWKELVNQVGDNQSLLQSLKDSPYYRGFEDKATIWESRFADLDEYLHNLNQIQRKWVYLEPIFGRGALPREQGRFKRVDDDYRSILADIARDNRVLSLVAKAGLRQLLVTLLDQLQRCQKSLNEFLEEKRSVFPRFYFIGDDDLLEILGQSTNPNVIQSHLKKLFAGIHSVEFGPDSGTILAMKSLDGEVVPLKRPVNVTPEVEIWLGHLSNEMQETLKELLNQCVHAGRAGTSEVDPNVYPSQILCLSDYILFTERCETAIKQGRLSEFLIETESRLDSYTSVDMSGESSSLSLRVLELKLKAMVLDTIHFVQVVKDLIQAQVKSIDDWLWQKQLRFYLIKGSCISCMCDAQFEYTYEYQGNASKLVHTPLTDKCYLTLTQGMDIGLGGNPYGPAGTGKTESVKALGGLMGRQVLVFNCDEGIDVKSMGRIFIGLVKCGAWGCFDEFNRLEEAVLSAVSMQIQVIQAAIKNKSPSIELLERDIEINTNSGIFITLNPAGKGYGGRQKLPDNLKQLFRPVAMSKPDNDLIAEVILFSEGYKHAESLGRKIVAIFNLSKELLSRQQHYDWGLRALKTVLKSCGHLLLDMKNNLKSRSEEEQNVKIDIQLEGKLVVQALRINTLSKLTFTDSKRFDALIQDVFQGIPFSGTGYEKLAESIRQVCQEFNLSVNERQVKKALELYEQLRQRMGVVVVGPSGSGKTTLWRVLKAALAKTGQVVKQYTMNPKAMPRTQLLGQIDIDTREWSDGVLTYSARQVVREPIEIQSWIICDGDIDPEWVESLNSVLDDNRLLTMPSGERIQFGPNVNFLFETHDLSCASPATISRMGMIFLSDEDTDIKAIIASWLRGLPDEDQKRLQTWIEDYFFRAFDWVWKQNDLVIDTSMIGMVMNGLSHLRQSRSKGEFAVNLIRGLGANLHHDSRVALAKEVFNWVRESPPDSRRILDSYYDSDSQKLKTYEIIVPDHLTVENFFSNQASPVINTADAQRSIDIFNSWLDPNNRQPFILVGPEGCGKELLLHYCFSQLRSCQVALIHCSSQTSPSHVIQKLNQMCIVISTNTGRVYRPKDCERLILYLKDLNLPKPDKWNTSQLIAFLQQLLTYNGFYDSNLEWVGLEGIQIVSSMNPSTTLGRYPLTTRFTSIVRICSVAVPEDLRAIYGEYLRAILHHSLSSHPVWGSIKNVHTLAGTMVNIYEQVRSKFTVDDYSHYLFTPRDLTRWTLGLLRYDLAESSGTGDSLLTAFAYEANKLFRDRLVGSSTLDRFDNIVQSNIRADWSFTPELKGYHYVSWGATQSRTTVPSDDQSNTLPAKPIYGRLLGKLSAADFQQVVKKGLQSYSRENGELNILIFDEVLDLIARVERVITQPGGSLLLAGRSGVGRRTAVRLVTHLHQMTLFTPKVSRNYGLKQFRNDLKSVMQQAGVEGENVVLLIEDYQVVEAEFLEIINSLLSGGEVPGLYSTEELEPLLTPLRDQASQDGFRGPLLSYFTSRVRSKLHCVLIMDNTNAQFSVACKSNPAFYKACSFQWMDSWSTNSLMKIPQIYLDPHTQSDSSIKNVWNDLAKAILHIHESAPIDSTPRRFMTLLQSCQAVYNMKREGIEKRQSRLQAGLSKLNEAKSLVDDLKKDAAKQSTLLAEKQADADQALQEISTSMQRASDQRNEMEILKQKLAEESAKLEKRKKAIDIELSEIEPLVQSARQAVGNIKPESLSEIRSLRMPPDVIRDILEGVLRLMGIFDTSWVSMKSFLAKRGVKEEICTFDARKITTDIRDNVNELLKSSNSFDEKVAKRASAAAAPLAEWVKANIKFSIVLEKIEPLETEQNALKRNLDKSQARLDKLVKALNAVDKEVAAMKERFEKRTTEAAKLKIQLEKAQETIDAAETLVTKLDGEYKRWSTQVTNLTSEMNQLPRWSLITAGFMTYLGSAPENVRENKIHDWCRACNVDRLDLRRFLSTESEQLSWKAEGLPSDNLSIENAIFILKSSITPFLVDPSMRATDWLKTHLKDARLEIVNQQDPNFTTSLELAIRFGKTLIIQEVDNIEPILIPLLRNDLISQGPRYVIQIGEKVIDYNEDFKLYLATRNPQPELPSDAASIVNEINFTTTKAGLTAQLLAMTIQNEKPELEVRKMEFLKTEEELKIQVEKLEDSLLEELAQAEGNILENKDLIESLNKTKASSITIAESLQESLRLQSALDQERDVYRPLAEYGSSLLFVITDLSKLNNMYRFSLSSFLRLFQRALKSELDAGNIEMRIKLLMSSLRSLVYEYACRSLYKADHLTFAMHLVHGIRPELFQEQEWEFFCGLIVSDVNVHKQEGSKRSHEFLPNWCDAELASSIAALKTTFPTWFQNLKLDDNNIWSTFSRHSQCEKEFPSDVTRKISEFQQVLTIQALRPDRLQSAMSLFAARALNMKELSPPTLNLKRLYTNETVADEPILIIISPGADPSQELQDLASKTVGEDKYHQVAMGQGQADIAIRLLRDCARNGDWLCLKNLHLVTSWLPILEKEFKSLEPHQDFRLWLTSEVHPKFTPILLQSSLKVTYEAPPGVKRNLQRTLESWSTDFFQKSNSPIRAQALFTAAWFHAIVQERRSYIPQGWSKFYEFSRSDLRCAAEVIERVLKKSGNDSVKWEFVHGLLENAVYGGRIDNPFDIRVLESYLHQCFNKSVIGGQSGRRKPLTNNFSMPQSSHYQDYMDMISLLSDNDQPSLFGLPANIERSIQRSISTQVISQLKVLMRADAIVDKFDKEKWQTELGPILQLWKKLNQGTKLLQEKGSFPSGKAVDESPVTAFIQLERYNAIKLMQSVHGSLSGLNKVIRGNALLTTAITALAGALLKNEVPSSWSNKWDGPEDPMQWLRALVAKTLALGTWVQKSESGSLLSESLDLAELFHPDTFLNALRQQTARGTKLSMDNLKLQCSWDGEIKGAMHPVKITGLQIEGCIFDGSRFSDCQRDTSSISAVPDCKVAWVPKEMVSPYPEKNCMLLPVYYDTSREGIVTKLNVPCGGQQIKWIQCNTALFLKKI